MRIVALETSAASGSVALLEDDRMLAERRLDSAQNTGAFLAPALADLLSQQRWRGADVDLVAVTQGPGSFTGLRVGLATAKAFAYAAKAELLGIDTLEVIARQVFWSGIRAPRLHVVMDAQRRQLYAAEYALGAPQQDQDHPCDDRGNSTSGSGDKRGFDDVQPLQGCRIVDARSWADSVGRGDLVAGPVAGQLARRFDSLAGDSVNFVEKGLNVPSAAAVGHTAWGHFRAGRRHSVWGLLPEYYRASAAEEKRTAKRST